MPDLVDFRITFVAIGLLGLAAAMRFLVLPANAGPRFQIIRRTIDVAPGAFCAL